MKGAVRIFLQDVVDNTTCPVCQAEPGQRCVYDDPPSAHESVLTTHVERQLLRRSQMSDSEYAAFGIKMLNYFDAVERRN